MDFGDISCKGNVGLTGQSGCRVYLSGNQSCPDDAYTKVAFNAETYDTLGEFDAVTNYKFTALATGKYLVTSGVTFAAGSGGNCSVYIKANGNFTNGNACCGSTTYHTIVVTDIVSLAAGEYFEIYAYHDSAGAIIITGNTYSTWLTVQRIA